MRRLPLVGLVSGSSLAASGLSYIVLVAAGRSLNAHDFADFAAAWGAIFGSIAILGAIELESSRQAAEGQDVGPLVRTAILLGLAVIIIGIAASPLTQALLHLSSRSVAIVIPLLVATYPLYFVLRGTLAGGDHLVPYASTTFLEGALRPLAMIPLSGNTPLAYLLAAGAGSAAFLPWIGGIWDRARGRWSKRQVLTQLRRLAPLLSGNIAAALLITGLPATATVMLGDADSEAMALALATVTISRIPLILLNSVYGLLVPWFVGQRGRVRATSIRYILASLVAAPVVTLMGGAVTLIGTRFTLDRDAGLGLGLATLFFIGAIVLGLLTIATARLVAADGSKWVQRMWWTSALVSIGTMLLLQQMGISVALVLGLAQLLGPVLGGGPVLVAARISGVEFGFGNTRDDG